MSAERSSRSGRPELTRRDLLRGAAGLAIGAATSSLLLPESASARSISTPNSPTRRTENAPGRIDQAALTEALRPNLTLQGTDFRLEDGTQLEIRLLDNTDQGVRHLKEGIAALKQTSILTQEVRSQLAKSESGRETLRLHSLAADTNRNAFLQAEAGGGSFTLNGHMVDDRFGTYWIGNGGLRQQGLPLSDGFNEKNPTNGQMYQTQYFERARFEYHPEVSDLNYQVLLGLTGAEQYKSKYPTGAANQIPNTAPGAAQFPETGKYVGDRFLAYWAANGGLRQQGLPISDEFDEVNPTDGKSYRVQYFERARFEHHPEIADPNYKVLLGLLGREQFLAKYPNGLPAVEPPPSAEKHLLIPRTSFRKTAEEIVNGKLSNPGGWTDAVLGHSGIKSIVDPEFRDMRFMYTRVKSIDRAGKEASLYIQEGNAIVTVSIPDAVSNPDNRFCRAQKTSYNIPITWNDLHIYGVNPYIDIEGEDPQRNIKGDVAMVFFTLDEYAKLESNTANLAGVEIYV